MKKFKPKLSTYGGAGVADATSGARYDNGLGTGRTKNAEAHTAKTKYGMGDYYGTGMRAPLATIRGSSTVGMRKISKALMKSPPKSTA